MERARWAMLVAVLLFSGCAGSQVGEISRPLSAALQVTLDDGCEEPGQTVSVQGAMVRGDVLYVEYFRGHGCDVHTPQVCTDDTVELPAVRYLVRDVTEDMCDAEALELVAISGIPDDLELRAFGDSAVEGEIVP